VHVGDDRIGVIAPRGSIKVGFNRVLGLESRDIGPDIGIFPVPLKKVPDPGPRIAEQRLMNEVDRCGRALDVQEDGADLRQRDAVFRIGM
jgi:hypothetical protein